MYCENCGKEIGDRNSCNFCGYDPMLDGGNAVVEEVQEVPPVEIKKLKIKNKAANTAFVLGFFNIFFYPIIPCFILSLVGLKKSSRTKTGLVKSILALLSSLIFIGGYSYIIYSIYMLQQNG